MSGSVSQSRPSLADLLMGVPPPSGPVPLSSLRMPSDLSGVPLGSILTMPSPDVSLMQPGSMPTTRELAAQPVSQFVNPATGAFTPEGMARANDVANMAMAMGGVGPSGGGFRAFHGSPHSFDAFDASKIGTGEGAQAYGHGLYVADTEGTAGTYKSAGPAASAAYDAINQRLSQLAKVMDKDSVPGGYRKFKTPEGEAAASEYDSLMDKKASGLGHMYEVQVNADPAHFLDWDTPISRQSDHVVNSLKQANGIAPEADMPASVANMTGQQLYQSLAKSVGGHDVAAQVLQEKYGIPGIRYLDAGSRGAGEGSRNSVVFDANSMEILRKYGLAGLMAGGGAAAGLQQIGGDNSQ